jgi:hypothetical protein
VYLSDTNNSKEKSSHVKITVKTLLITFFHSKDIIHFEFIPQGQTVNQAYYVELLKLCIEKPRTLAQQLDFPPQQCSSLEGAVKQFLTKKSITEMENSPHSRDLAPNDVWLFPKIKSALKGQRFQDIGDIQKM